MKTFMGLLIFYYTLNVQHAPDYPSCSTYNLCCLNSLVPWFATLAAAGRNSHRNVTFSTRQVTITRQMQKSSTLLLRPTPVSPASYRTVGPLALQFQLIGRCYHVSERFSKGELQCWRPTRRRIRLTEGRTADRGTWASLLGKRSASCRPFHHYSPEIET